MTHIKIIVEGAHAEMIGCNGVLTAGMVGATVAFEFDHEWDCLLKTAVFIAGSVTRDQVLDENTVQIPHEVLRKAGEFLRVGVYGYREAGEIVIPTVMAYVGKIMPGADPSGDPSVEPTPGAAEQMMTLTQNAKELAEEAEKKAQAAQVAAEQSASESAQARQAAEETAQNVVEANQFADDAQKAAAEATDIAENLQQYVKDKEESMKATASLAATKATDASMSASEAARSQRQAAQSETNAKTSEQNAGSSATAAATSAANAAQSEANAKISEENAAASAQSAYESMQNAGKSEKEVAGYKAMISAELELATEEYQKAKANADEAKAAQTAAEQAEENAKTSENNAKIFSDVALTNADSSANSARTATEAKNSAAESVNAAANSERNAKTAETNAVKAAADAVNSEGNAKASADRAAASEEAARKAAASVDLPKPSTETAGMAIVVSENGEGFTFGKSGGVDVAAAKVGQTIRVKAVDAKGIPTEWEAVDYQEKICGAEGGVEILPETAVSLDGGEGMISSEELPFEVGKTYIINFNGTEYPCMAQDASAVMAGVIFLGEGYDLGLSGNGEPFNVMVIPGTGTVTSVDDGALTEATFSIRTAETIQTIPPKYLPEGVPYIEDGGMAEMPVEGAWGEDDLFFALTAPIGLKAGKTYIVNWNGTEHTCVATEFSQEGVTAVFMGNAVLVGGEDDGTPFAIVEFPAEIAAQMGFYGMVQPLDGAEVPFTIFGGGGRSFKLANSNLELGWMATKEDVWKEVCAEKTVHDFSMSYGKASFEGADVAKVTFDGTDYVCNIMRADNMMSIGNIAFHKTDAVSTGEPFLILTAEDNNCIFYIAEGYDRTTTLVSASVPATQYNKLPVEYLPVEYLPKTYTITLTEEQWATRTNGVIILQESLPPVVDILNAGGTVFVAYPDGAWGNITSRVVAHEYAKAEGQELLMLYFPGTNHTLYSCYCLSYHSQM